MKLDIDNTLEVFKFYILNLADRDKCEFHTSFAMGGWPVFSHIVGRCEFYKV